MKREPHHVVSVATNATDKEMRVLMWRCPGCGDVHQVQVRGADHGAPRWGWDGSLDKPTITPSILKDPAKGAKIRCHSFVRNGVVEFLGDCDHELASQRVAMLPENADPFAKWREG